MNHRLMRIITVLQSPLFTLFRGRFMFLPTLRLTVTGRRTGRDRRVLLLFGVDGDRLVVVASAGGAQADPQWCKNLRVNPEVRVERAGHAIQRYTASDSHGEERERLFAIMTAFYPRYSKYQRNAGRLIPVVVLTPVEG